VFLYGFELDGGMVVRVFDVMVERFVLGLWDRVFFLLLFGWWLCFVCPFLPLFCRLGCLVFCG